MTLPCIACGKPLKSAMYEEENQPYAGTCFHSPGHYGSTVFDPMDGTHIEINVCDPCLIAAGERGSILHYSAPKRSAPWKPPTPIAGE